MKRFIRILSIAFMCGILVVPPVEAQNRRAPSRDQSGSHGRPAGGAHGSRPSAPAGGTRPSRPDNGRPSRPGGNGSNHGGRPSRPVSPNPPGNNANRPGRPGDNRPGHPGGEHRPGWPGNSHNPGRPHPGPSHNPSRPKPPVGGVHRPGPRPPYMAPPRRPYRPVVRPWVRPVPPPSWRPYRGCPVIGGILGITFGTAIGVSLDYLYGGGYTVDGYGPDVVYLRNVSQLSYIWPDATLYYGTGGFDRSQFVYSTGGYDISRYNGVYNNLVLQYGSPVNYVNNGNGFTATWFGNGNGYISLHFGPNYTTGGQLRYFTTLTFGN